MDRLKADLREHGFGMFEGALDTNTTARIRDRVLEQGAAERRVGYGTTNISVEPHDDVNQWVAFLPNKGKVFRTLISKRPGTGGPCASSWARTQSSRSSRRT